MYAMMQLTVLKSVTLSCDDTLSVQCEAALASIDNIGQHSDCVQMHEYSFEVVAAVQLQVCMDCQLGSYSDIINNLLNMLSCVTNCILTGRWLCTPSRAFYDNLFAESP